jgi:hypothetical protein
VALKSRLSKFSRDILTPMNYGRGLRRVYALLTVAWIALVVSMVVSNRWVWTPWRITPTTEDALLKEYGGVVADPNDHQYDDSPLVKAVGPPVSRKIAEVAALALPIPITGYLLLFYAVPWVFRGFKSTLKTDLRR